MWKITGGFRVIAPFNGLEICNTWKTKWAQNTKQAVHKIHQNLFHAGLRYETMTVTIKQQLFCCIIRLRKSSEPIMSKLLELAHLIRTPLIHSFDVFELFLLTQTQTEDT